MNQAKPKRKLPSILRWVLWVLLVQFVLINISAALYAYKLTHFYTDPTVRNGQNKKNILERTWKIFTGPRFARSNPGSKPSFAFDSVNFKTVNGTQINAWYGRTDSMARGTVVMFHGVTANKSTMLPEAAAFLEMNLNVLLVDFRGHGSSGGNHTTLGVRETEEVRLAYDFLSAQGERKIYLYGVSMGAVVVVKAVKDHQLSPAGIILEMPYASLASHLRARARTLGFPGFPEKPFGFLVGNWIGWERGFNGMSHRTTRYAKQIHCPVLLQWGAKDDYVLKWETEAVFNAIATPEKKLVIYPNAGHESLLRNDSLKWKNEVAGFLIR